MSLFGEAESGVKPDRTISSGGQPAHHVAYHHDGRLLALGCDHGYIKICDSQSRATIRTFTTHGVRGGFPIRTTGWLPEGKNKQRMIWSAGDDATLRIWDLSGDIVGVGDNVKPLAIMKGHGDAVRSTVLFSHDEKSCLVTGSYDHTLRVWSLDGLASTAMSNQDDEENDRCVSVMDHGAPVEELLLLHPRNEAPIIVSAGGTTIKLWNPILGECLSTIQTKHSKTITSLCLATIIGGTGERDGAEGQTKTISKRILSGGLDGLIRIYSADNIFDDPQEKKGGENDSSEKYHLQYLHGVKTPLPITAMAMSPDNTRLVIGSNNGMVTVRQRAKFVVQGVKRKNKEQPRSGTYSYFMRGAAIGADADDHIVMIEKKKKLQKYDQFLQRFRHGDALDAALASRDPQAIAGILEELGRRRGLLSALSSRDEETLEPLLAFTTSFITKPRYTPLLVGVANQLCEIYSNVIGQSDTIDEYFKKLQTQVKNECNTQSSLLQLVGQIETAMYAAENLSHE